MPEIKHTLGPWQWDPEDRLITGEAWRGVASLSPGNESAGPVMAAAPELLFALRDAVAAYGQPGGPWNIPDDPGGWLARAQAAIAKAEGGSR